MSSTKEKLTKLIIDLQYRQEDFAQNATREANEVFRELVRQMLLAGTIVLSVSALIFQTSILKSIDVESKRWLYAVWVTIGTSILFGILQLFEDHSFFTNWQRTFESNAKDIGKSSDINELAASMESVRKRNSVEPRISSTLPVKVQATTMFAAMIFLVIFLIRALSRA